MTPRPSPVGSSAKVDPDFCFGRFTAMGTDFYGNFNEWTSWWTNKRTGAPLKTIVDHQPSPKLIKNSITKEREIA